MSEFRFVAPASDDPLVGITLDHGQRQVVDAQGSHLQVIGAPGSGKSTALVAAVAHRLASGEAPESILVLAPTRTAAARLSAQIDPYVSQISSATLVRTVSSLAFDVLRVAAAADAGAAPRLLTGGEQDRLLAEVIAGYDSGEVFGHGPQWPEVIGADVRVLRGFRTELRELFARCFTAGISPERLHALGVQQGRPIWVAAARVFDDYLSIKAATSITADAFDPSELVALAARRLADHPPEFVGSVRSVFVDDAQEQTEAIVHLVRPLVTAGARVQTFGDPDQATNGFRGGRAESTTRIHRELGVQAESVILPNTHRLRGDIATAVRLVTARVGAAEAGEQRAVLTAAENDAPGSERGRGRVTAESFTSEHDEIAGVADFLRSRHIEEEIPWSQLAVITRSGGRLAELARDLEAFGVPVAVGGVAGALRDEAVNLALLHILQVGCGLRALDESLVVDLLTGPLGGVDALGLRRVRRGLREHELRAGGTRRSGELLLAAIREGDLDLSTLSSQAVRDPLYRLHRILSIVATQAAAGAQAVDLLWTAWSASDVASAWQQQALTDGVQAADANRRLDAVVGLFAAAERFAERFPEAPAAAFVEQQLRQSVPEDSLAHTGRRDAVHLGTPTSAIGRAFDSIAIVGVHDGVWPDLRVRNTLLGVDDLTEAVSGENDIDPRLGVLHDELRLFVQAISRAREAVLITTVIDEDHAPSAIFRLLAPAITLQAHERDPIGVYTLRGLVGALRRQLNQHPDDVDAAQALARLAREGIEAAAPSHWAGLAEPSTVAPLVVPAPDIFIPVSPSNLEMFQTDQLQWFLQHIGADSRSLQAGVGRLVHTAFERAGRDGVRDLEAVLEPVRDRWGELDFETSWQSKLAFADVSQKIERVRQYLLDADADRRLAFEFETSFTTRAGIAELRGTIDRLERTDDGRIHIIDLKTGVRITEDETAEHLQLLAYQIAAAKGAVDGVDLSHLAGADLLFVGGAHRNYTVRSQSALDDAWVRAAMERIDELARGMAGNTFWADRDRIARAFGLPPITALHLRGEITWLA